MPDLYKYTKRLSEHFFNSDNILLISHINPDGDAIGSQLALYHYLVSSGKNVTMISPNNLQEFLRWMEGSDLIHVYIRQREKCRKLVEAADLIVMLDFNQPDRLGEMEDLVTGSGTVKIIIDHHLDPKGFADFEISDSGYCSTAELVHELITEMNGNPFRSKPYSEAIYVGIITDTGNFEYGSYTSRTLRIVADLLDTGIEKERILNLVYNNFSENRLRLQGFALNERMVVLPEYQTAYIWLTRADLDDYKYAKGDTEGFVNLPLSIKGIIFSAFFVEKEGFVKLSFRSTGNFPSNKFASDFFSGGGHMNASGGEYRDSLENSIAYFLKILKENFRSLNGNK
ncbi:MAG TPA: bifunctional oligoribonuclease/PAP phosphatase NrnA [Bacteroidales bacterium]|nr:bifunctional oligoribonuclease/PAP phosphatase NrnA [Bacteroidales bacterium]